ncbi:hypothetical protein [Streptomyces sp. NPDC005009]
MSRLQKTFRAIDIGDGGDDRWAGHVQAMWPRAEGWMTEESRTAEGADVAAMLEPPLYQYAYDEGLGTVYTARYRPAEGRVTYHWPGETWEQSFTDFAPGSRTVALGGAG